MLYAVIEQDGRLEIISDEGGIVETISGLYTAKGTRTTTCCSRESMADK